MSFLSPGPALLCPCPDCQHLSRAWGPAVGPPPAGQRRGVVSRARIVLGGPQSAQLSGRDELAVGVNTELDSRSADSAQAAAVCPHFTAALIFDTCEQRDFRGREENGGLLQKVGQLTKEPSISIAQQSTPQKEEINEFLVFL